jgi:hypothetical protein
MLMGDELRVSIMMSVYDSIPMPCCPVYLRAPQMFSKTNPEHTTVIGLPLFFLTDWDMDRMILVLTLIAI